MSLRAPSIVLGQIPTLFVPSSVSPKASGKTALQISVMNDLSFCSPATSKPVCSHSVSMPTQFYPPSVFDNLTSILFRFSFLRGQMVNHCGLCANPLDIPDPPQESILVLPFSFLARICYSDQDQSVRVLFPPYKGNLTYENQ